MPKRTRTPHASVAETKARLSEYLRAVKAGGEVVITDRGRPVARLVPIALDDDADERTRRLVADGVVREPRRALPRDFLDRPRPQDAAGAVLEALLAERAEDR